MFLTTPTLIKETPEISFNQADLENGINGLFRAPLEQAASLMPSMEELVNSVPVDDKENWELDIKVHMLFENQYPCIPNWHCDNVPRVNGKTDYSAIEVDAEPMYLWISDGPETEFLYSPSLMEETPKGHADIADHIRKFDLPTVKMKPKAWTAMFQNTPHRGTISKKSNWRVFARLTHKSIAPTRPVTSHLRRHSQVYLDSKHFSW